MNVMAIYAVNQHLNDLLFEADLERIARANRPSRPGAIRRAAGAVRAAVSGRSVRSPKGAPAAS